MSGRLDPNGGDEQSQGSGGRGHRKNTIQILCCTGNIGNQEPDIRSVYEWIPIDGLTSKVLDHQKYPLKDIPVEGSATAATQKSLQQQDGKSKDEKGEDGDNKKDSDGDGGRDDSDGQDDVLLTPEQAKALDGPRFDVIAIGMQEATFELSSGISAAAVSATATEIQTNSTPANLNEHEDSGRNIDGDNDGDNGDAINPEKPSSQKKKSHKGPVRKKLGEVQTVFTDADYSTKTTRGKNGKMASFAGRNSDDGLDGDSIHRAIVGTTVRRLRSMASTVSSVAARDHGQSTTSTVQQQKQKALSSGNDDDGPNTENNGAMIEDSSHVVDDDDLLGREDTQYIHSMLRKHLPSYNRAVSYQRGQMRLLVFHYSNESEDSNNNNRNSNSNNSTKSMAANKTKIEAFDVLSVKAQNTGRAGLANKGGIVAEVDINNGTRISFLSAHLEAHEGLLKYNTRVSTIGDIFRGTQSSVMSDFGCDVSLSSHYSFVMGDLNFRTRLPVHEPGSEEHIKDVHQFTRDKYWEMLNECDELAMAVKSKDCLVGYVTPKCNFPPTFKLLRQRGYSYNEKRSPSYTDRILHKGNHLLSRHIEILSYGPIDNFTSSDHKPIRGAYSVQLNKPLKWRPVLVHNDNSVRWNPGRPGRIIRGMKSMDSTSGRVGSDNLHIFCSSIQCELTNEKYGDVSTETNPSPFVSFVSTPNTAMKIVTTSKKKWAQYVHFWKPKKKSSANAADGTQLHNGWPRSQTILNEKDAQWEEEVHFEIRTHDDTGKPLNLTGSVLYILVHDEKDDSHLIGSCAVNLAYLIEMSRSEKEEDDRKKVESSRSPGARTSSSRNIALAFATRLMNKIERSTSSRNSSSSADDSSILKGPESPREMRGRTLAPVNEDHHLSETLEKTEHLDPAISPNEKRTDRDRELERNNTPADSARSREEVLSSEYTQSRPAGALGSAFDPRRQESGERIEDIHSIDIDEALTKNGKEVGRMKLTIATWWLSEKVSHGEGLIHRRHPDAPRRRKNLKSRLKHVV